MGRGQGKAYKNDANYLAHPADTVAASVARLRQLNLCSCFSFASEIPRLPLIKGLFAIDWEPRAWALGLREPGQIGISMAFGLLLSPSGGGGCPDIQTHKEIVNYSEQNNSFWHI